MGGTGDSVRSMAASPEALREALAGYVRALHQAYLDAAAELPPLRRHRLPLLDSTAFTVAIVGTRHLHLLASLDHFPEPVGPEVAIAEHLPDMNWTTRFYDPLILPALGQIDESDNAEPASVRRVLGASTVLYHLVLPPGSGLTAHHAMHAGTGLANSHMTRERDYERIAQAYANHPSVVDDMRNADDCGLEVAVTALAQVLLAERGVVLPIEGTSADAARHALLDAVRMHP